MERIDKAGFEKIFLRFYPRLVAFAFKQTDNLEASEDIVQDFFTSFFENPPAIQSELSLKSYLYKAISNRCKSHFRKLETVNSHLQSLDETDFITTNSQVEEVEFEYMVFQMIEELPKGCRTVFKLSRVDGKTNDEIAGLLEISKRTVETQITKALRILRRRLAAERKHFLIFFL